LDPKIKRTEWSQEEQWVLFILRNQSHEKWSLISKKLMGRTDNAVKNYWNSRLKKRIDSMQHAVNQHFERKKKQKICQMTQLNSLEMTDAEKKDPAESLAQFTKDQKKEL
jgi:myb proto-oncogene protein